MPLLHASRSGYFPFCISDGEPLPPTIFGLTKPISIQNAMNMYWNVKSLQFSINLYVEFFLDFGEPIGVIKITASLSDAGNFLRANEQISENQYNLVCYALGNSNVEWFKPSDGKIIGTSVLEYITYPEEPQETYDLYHDLLFKFLGFPIDPRTQSMKRTQDGLYACGNEYTSFLQGVPFVGIGQFTTSPSYGYGNTECGKFTSPFLGDEPLYISEVPLYWSINDFSGVSVVSASGNLEISVSEVMDWS